MKRILLFLSLLLFNPYCVFADDKPLAVIKGIPFGVKHSEVEGKLKILYGCEENMGAVSTTQRCDKGIVDFGTYWIAIKGFKLTDSLYVDTRFYFNHDSRFYLLSFISKYSNWPLLKDILKRRYGGEPECPNLDTPLMMTFPAAISCAWETKDTEIALLPSISGDIMAYIASKELSQEQKLHDEKLRINQIEKGVESLQ